MKRRTKQDYIACAEAGMTGAETAIHLDVHPSTVWIMAKTHGIEYRRVRKVKPKRYEIYAEVDGIGLVKHVIKKPDAESAKDRFRAAYPLRNVQFLSLELVK